MLPPLAANPGVDYYYLNWLRMNTTIRQAQAEDIPTLVAIIRTAFKKAADRLGLTAENSGHHASSITDTWVIEDMDEGVRYFIIEEGGVPAGAVTMEHARPEVCYIGRLSVLPDYQGRGLGHELLAFAIREAAKTAADHASIGVISDEKRLIEWYVRMGFTTNRQIKFEHFPFEVTLMRRELKEK
jgi:ribosomal protein S18 acetylase RimI-like enzyme